MRAKKALTDRGIRALKPAPAGKRTHRIRGSRTLRRLALATAGIFALTGGLAYANGHVYLASHAGNSNIRILDQTTGADLGGLNLTGLTGGTNSVRVRNCGKCAVRNCAGLFGGCSG